MSQRFVAIWFPQLITDWLMLRRPSLKQSPFVFAAPTHNRMIVTSASPLAAAEGIGKGMLLADARALVASLLVFDDKPERPEKLLAALAEYCIRYTPHAGVDLPDGIMLDASGCAHLWGGEKQYLTAIINRFKTMGYTVRVAMADTIGSAWAMAHYGGKNCIVEAGQQEASLINLPAAALRLPAETLLQLQKLGLNEVGRFLHMPGRALRRRFGNELLLRINQAMGYEPEIMMPVHPSREYQERLSCLEPIATATGIEIALKRLLEIICNRLQKEEKGLREASFKGYRLDGKMVQIAIGTNAASNNPLHLFKLFEFKIATIEPDLGIELFVLEAGRVETVLAGQQKLWAGSCGLQDAGLISLLDRITNKLGAGHIQRYLPAEHYWPERSMKPASGLDEQPSTAWQTERTRPVRLLSTPEPVEVSAPVPDYPPMLFRYKNKVHNIKKADGPERIEREWWLEEGDHRDYYCVEDQDGHRYWIFRSGHYTEGKKDQWYIHGFFA